MSKNERTVLLDKIGMCTSSLCILHCIAFPFLLIFGSETLLRIIDNPWIEGVLIASALIIGIFAFVGGYLRHRQHFIPVLFLAGFLLLINGESVPIGWISLILSIAGAAIIVYAHYLNLKWKSVI